MHVNTCLGSLGPHSLLTHDVADLLETTDLLLQVWSLGQQPQYCYEVGDVGEVGLARF